MTDLTKEQRDALKAFKKRLKSTQLEEDSRLGRGPMSSDKAKVTAITPPTGFGKQMWIDLAAKGYLRADGGGFYELVSWKTDEPKT